MFFPDTPQLHSDPVLTAVGERAAGLIGVEEPGEDGIRRFRFDIRMRGENETPFFLD